MMSTRLAFRVMVLGTLFASAAANADGMLDFMDPCKKGEKQFKNASEAIRSKADGAVAKVTAWGEDPTKLPDDVLLEYRAAVRALAFRTWSDSPTGKGVIASWGNPSGEEIQKKFFEHIYPNEIPPEVEVNLAREIFKQDFEQTIKPKMTTQRSEIDKEIESKKTELNAACRPDVVSQILRGTIGNLVIIVDGNFKAAKDEKGEIAYLVRGVTGISITDIMRYGLAGGPNSEIHKLKKTWTDALDNAGIGPNNEIRKALAAIDPTNLDVPKELQITIDGDSGKNLIKNLTFGLF